MFFFIFFLLDQKEAKNQEQNDIQRVLFIQLHSATVQSTLNSKAMSVLQQPGTQLFYKISSWIGLYHSANQGNLPGQHSYGTVLRQACSWYFLRPAG